MESIHLSHASRASIIRRRENERGEKPSWHREPESVENGTLTFKVPSSREKFIEPVGRADALKTSLRGCSDISDAFARSRVPRWKSALSERVGQVLLKKTRRTLTKNFRVGVEGWCGERKNKKKKKRSLRPQETNECRKREERKEKN